MSKRLFIRAFMTFTILTLVLCNFLSSARAQTWVDLELYGGQMYDIAIDPSNTNHMFAGGYLGGGLYSTTNGGTNWQAVLTGEEGSEMEGEATFRNHAVWAVKIAPSNNSHVWAVHNYWAEKSTNGGTTWTHIWNSTMQGSEFRFCKSLAIDPQSSTTIYVGTAGYSTDLLPYGTIYKTTDGGTSWYNTGPYTYSTGYGYFYYQFPGTVVDVEIDPSNRSIVWAITSNGYIFRNNNYGERGYWSLINTWSTTLYDIEVNPNDSNAILVAGYAGIRKYYNSSPPESGTWYYTSVASTSENLALAFAPATSGLVYAAGGGNSVGRSTNGGDSFTWSNVGYKFHTLEVHPSNSNVIFGGEYHLGVYRGVYSSGNYTWTPYKNGVTSIMVWDIAIDPNDDTHYLAATEAGVYEKQGAGAWAKISSFTDSSAYSVAFDPSSTSTYYAGVDNVLQKTTNGGISWIYSNSLSGRVNDIAINGTTIFVTTRNYGNGRVYKGQNWSTNGGGSFSNVTPTGASFDFSAVAIDPTNSNNVFVGGGNYFGTKVLGNLYKSTTGGGASGSWTTSLANVIVNALLIDPDNTNIIYAGCGYSGGTEVPLYKSTNGGSTWVKAYEGIPGEPARYGIWGSSASNFWVLRHNGSVVKDGGDDTEILYYNGSWSLVDIGVSTPLHDIWGSSGSNIFAVGDSGTIVRYNGTAWTERVSGTTEDLLGVWSSGSTVFVVGETGTTRRSTNDGVTWSPLTSGTTKDLYGVWGSSASNVYAVGSYGTILSFNGSSWSAMESGVTTHLEGVWGSSSSDVFAVGDPWFDGGDLHFTILHWNGTNWQVMITPAVPGEKSGKLHSVWGISASNVYAVGEDGVILRYSGSSWSLETSGTATHLYGVWGTASNNIYAVGLYGTIRHYTGSSWTSTTVTGLPNNRNEYTNNWNAVTDIKFKDETGLDGGSNRNIYASTDLQGVYFSPNQAGIWFNLGAPGYTVFAIDTGSIVLGLAGAANGGGEIGWIYGYVRDDVTGLGILNAAVTATNYVDSTESADSDSSGYYFIHDLLAGNYYDVTAVKEGYDTESTTEYYSSPPAYVAGAYALNVDFNLHDPLITVTINGQEVEATGGIFQTVGGSITPTGDIKWSMPPNNGLLMVQYQGSATLTIAPAPGYEVQDVLVDGASIGQQTQYTFENMVADREIEVIFAPISTYTVNFVAGSGGTIIGDTSQQVAHGGNCTAVTANPNTGYSFTGWTGSYTGTDNPLTITNVTSNMTITANFTPISTYYTVTFIAGSGGIIIGDTSQQVAHGGNCTAVTANPNTGYSFTGWTGSYTGTDNPLTITNVTSNMTITANFTINQYTVNFVAGTGGTISGILVQSVDHGGDCSEVTANPDTGYTFSGWTGDYTGSTNPLTITNVTSNMTITANFNAPPNPPVLSSPGDGEINVSLTPELRTGAFSDPDGDTHAETTWQISTQNDFSSSSLVLNVTSDSHFTSLTVPEFIINVDDTYYWRVKFIDSRGAASEWSDPYFSFTTIDASASDDTDSNGIPDTQEVDNAVDLDGNGEPDNIQSDIKSVNTVVVGGQIGVKEGTNITSVDSIKSIDPDTISDTTNKPDEMPLGLITFKVTVDNPGDDVEVTVYLSEPVSSGAKWYTYDIMHGWREYPYATIIPGETYVTLALKDGDLEFGDMDGTENRIIIDPSGLGATSTPSPPPPAPSGGGGGGCFIATAAYGSCIEKHVKILRDFRDRFLVTNSVGRAFVDLYSTYSPPVADFIANHDIVRFMVRWSLLPFVSMCWVAINIGPLPALIFIILFGFGLFHLMGTRRKLSKENS